jgi:hypothetical protein
VPDDHAPADVDTTDAQLRRRWSTAVTIVAVFLIALLVGLWVGGDVFGS